LLNIPTEHDFHDAFKKLKKHWEWCIHAEGDCLEGNGPVGLKLVFDQMAAPVLEIMNGSL
jgi:hypothetical protein